MTNEKSSLADQLLSCLASIKRRYTITQHPISNTALLSPFSQPCSDSQTSILTKMLAQVQREKIHFETCPTYQDSTPSPIRSPQFYFEMSNRKIQPVDVTPIKLIRSASDLYHCLMAFHDAVLAINIKDQLQTYYSVEAAVIETANNFEKLLGQLSDYIEKSALQSSAFSLSKYIENIKQNYDLRYNQDYPLAKGFRFLFNCQHVIRYPFINSTRLEEIEFISSVNLNSHCNDEIRYAMINVMFIKIVELESPYSSGRSELRKLLEVALKHAVVSQTHEDSCQLFDSFCREKQLKTPIPEKLSDYLHSSLNKYMANFW